jgi:hypothetical protein
MILVIVLAGFLLISRLRVPVSIRDEESVHHEIADVVRPLSNPNIVVSSARKIVISCPYSPTYTYVRVDNAVYPLQIQSNDKPWHSAGRH